MWILLFIPLLFQHPPTEYLIRHYTVDDGLPVNAISGIVQDSDGYLYVSTYNGLVRFDGYGFERFDSGNTPAMRSNRIAGLLITSDGTLWLFNEGGTLTSRKGSVFRSYATSELPGQAAWLTEDRHGRLWVGGSDGLAVHDAATGAFHQIETTRSMPVNVIKPHPSGGLYVVNNRGLYRFDGQTATPLLTDADVDVPFESILDLQPVGSTHLWLVGSDHLLLYDVGRGAVDRVVRRNADQLTLASTATRGAAGYILRSDGKYRVTGSDTSVERPLDLPASARRADPLLYLTGSQGEALLIGNHRVVMQGQVVYDGPPIKRVMVDQEGSLWIGTLADGLYQIRKSSFTNLGTDRYPGLSNVYSIIQDRSGAMWACSFASGIHRLTATSHRRWDAGNSSLMNSYCKVVFEDSDGTLYAGLNNEGLWVLRDGDWERLTGYDALVQGHRRSVEALHRQGGRLFVSGFSSLLVYEDNRFRYFDASQPRELSGIQVFAENPDGVIYAGTDGFGLNRIVGDTYRNYRARPGILNSNTIRDVHLQAADTIWVVHESVGLNRLVFDADGNVRASASVTSADGLPQNSLHRMIDDGHGHYWISGNSGIMRIAKSELNAYADGAIPELRVLSFNENDGMIDREANGGVQSAGIRTTDGRLWFPNQRGITIMNPTEFSVDYGLDVPRPVFEHIELDGFDLYIRDVDVIEIPGNQRDFRVNFAVPNFVNQDRLRFTYLLEGVNERWQNATTFRQAVFTGVPPGRHTLRIRSQFIGADPVESTILIVVPPYFHETTWFALLMAAGLIGLLYTAYTYRIRSMQVTERKLQDRVALQTEELRKAAEEKQRFFTGITHELKTPLSLIIGPLEDLMDETGPAADPAVTGRLALMQRNGHRLKHLVDQILDVSKLNADALALTPRPVRLPEFTRQIVGQFQSALEQADLTVDMPAAPVSGPIYVDREAWERIIINLMGNAIKFAPAGSAIRISMEERDDHVEVRIGDQGPGIAPEHHEKVFDYLYQVEGAKASEGTGIGLYLVKGLMDRMGGSIRVESEPGAGTEFVLMLKKGHAHFGPRTAVVHDTLELDGPAATAPVPKPAPGTATGSGASEFRLLVVEDNADFRTYLHSILSPQYEVLLAANGVDALALLEKETPDLVLSDIMMPHMNGLEFVRRVRERKPFEHLPVIFLSAKNEDTDVQTGLSTGADLYLAKPIRSSMLLSQIEAVLRRERMLRKGLPGPVLAREPEFLQRVREIVYRHLANPSLNVNQLADALYMSRGKLYLEWKRVSPIGLNEYVKQTRLNEARVLLQDRGFSVQEAARAVGFSDANYFSTSYKKHFGRSPTGK